MFIKVLILLSFVVLLNLVNCDAKLSQDEAVPSPSPYQGLDDDSRLYIRDLTEDKTVGTAYAPTTAGGKCINSEDYAVWTKNGFDNFGADMQHCAESCTGQLAPANCGFLAQCDPYPYRTCVTKCMANTSTSERTTLKLISGPYSANCSACMGSLSQCVVDNCTSKCLTGEKASSCESCTVKNCNPDFITCSGLNPGRAQNEVDTSAILGGVIGGAGALVIGSIFFAVFRYRRGHKVKELSIEDLAKLSQAQQQQAQMQAQSQLAQQPQQQKITQQDVIMMMQQAQQYGVVPAANPGNLSQDMTPYQQQYLMQQQQQQYQNGMQTPMLSASPMIASPQVHIPSMSAQKMFQNQISLSSSNVVAQTIELQVLYDFQGERDDELTCRKGDVVSGIEENDGWWLAKSPYGKIGLIPSSYVTVRDVRIGMGSGNMNY